MITSPYKVQVIFGKASVEAYREGEASLLVLAALGAVESFDFASMGEASAFCQGIETALGWEDALAVTEPLNR